MILLIGGAGFVGFHTISRLEEAGYDRKDIAVFDNFSLGRPDHLAGVNIITGDITRPEDVDTAMKDSEVVFHLAAIKEVPYSVAHPIETNLVNVCGTLNVLEAARKSNSRVIYASAASVYGTPRYLPIDEHHPTNPESPYGASKLAGEKYCGAYYYSYGLPTVCLRYTNVYGKGMTSRNVIEAFVDNALKGKPLVLQAGGEQKKQFTHVKDVSQANVLALKTNLKHGTFNIAGERPVAVKELASIVKSFIKSANIVIEEKRTGDIVAEDLHISIEKAKKELGYKPKISIEEGVKEYVEWKKSKA